MRSLSSSTCVLIARSLLLIGGLHATGAQAQSEADFDTVVERYVAEGLRGNLALQSENLEVEKAVQALAEARAKFFPEVSLQARYTRAEGGREITLPLGTALNPIYSTLNEMLVAQGQPARFPQIADETIRFQREREQDTRIVFRQPLYAPGIAAAVRAQRALLDASSYRRMAIARTLRRDITLGYLDWLRARSSMQIVEASENLLRENLRVNESLFDNGKITEDQVLRAKAEMLDVEQQKRNAANRATQAQSYLNFLLNRDLLSAIESSAIPNQELQQENALEQLWTQALHRRPLLGRGRSARGRCFRSQSMRARRAKTMASATVATSAPLRWCLPGASSMAAATRPAFARRAPASVNWCCGRMKSRSRSGSKCSSHSIDCKPRATRWRQRPRAPKPRKPRSASPAASAMKA